jgi:hypothetical protein
MLAEMPVEGAVIVAAGDKHALLTGYITQEIQQKAQFLLFFQ